MTRNMRKTYNKFMGYDTNNNMVFLETVFLKDISSYGKLHSVLHGATGYILEPLTQCQLDEIVNSPDTKEDFKTIWRSEVREEQTEQSFNEWYDDYAAQASDIELAGIHDDYYYRNENEINKLQPGTVTADCIASGRIFPCKIDYNKPHDDKIIAIVREAEKNK